MDLRPDAHRDPAHDTAAIEGSRTSATANRRDWAELERKTPPLSLGIPLSKHYAQAVRLRRPTLYPLSYRRAASNDTG